MSLMQYVSQLFRSSRKSEQPESAISSERDRPLEQIINEGSLGKIEEEGNFQKCFEPKPVAKTQIELDLEKFLAAGARPDTLIVMNENKFDELTKDFLNPLAIKGLRENPRLILIPDVLNIGIVIG